MDLKRDLGHWEFPHNFDISEWTGFIYRIVETTTGKEYIGKKNFYRNLTKVVKDRKNRKHFKKESDWKKYTGSSVALNLAIATNGKENYQFLILSLHKTKGSLHYREVELQVMEDVLRKKLPCGDRKYYNGNIAAVKFYPPEELLVETQHKI